MFDCPARFQMLRFAAGRFGIAAAFASDLQCQRCSPALLLLPTLHRFYSRQTCQYNCEQYKVVVQGQVVMLCDAVVCDVISCS